MRIPSTMPLCVLAVLFAMILPTTTLINVMPTVANEILARYPGQDDYISEYDLFIYLFYLFIYF